MNQELLLEVSMLQRQAEETQERVKHIEKEVTDLSGFIESLKEFNTNDDKTLLASFGKSVYVKTEVSEKKLFVGVGAGVIVRKNPQEVEQIVEAQLRRLIEARIYFLEQMNLLTQKLEQSFLELEKSQNTS